MKCDVDEYHKKPPAISELRHHRPLLIHPFILSMPLVILIALVKVLIEPLIR